MGMKMDIEGVIDITVDQIIEGTIVGKTMEVKGTELEALVRTAVGLGKDIDVIPGTTPGMGPITETRVEIETDQVVETKDKGPEQFPRIETEKIGPLQGLDLAPV